MGRKILPGLCSCAVWLVIAGQAGAVTVVYNDFSSTAGLAINGTAVGNFKNGIDSAPVLRLAFGTTYQSGSAFSQVQLNASDFSTFFQFRITKPGGYPDGTDPGADGLVFVIQPVSPGIIGSNGGGIGYARIQPSVGVEFDTWQNGEHGDISSNHYGFDVNGSVISVATAHEPTRFDNGNLWNVWVDYSGSVLEVRANQSGIRPVAPELSLAIDLPAIIGTKSAYVGFTAGTGAAYGNHDIVSWEYRDQFDPIGGAVPEPLTMLAVALGCVGSAIYGRRRMRTEKCPAGTD